MPNSLRAKVKHLAYKGILTQKESDKIRDALLKQKPQKPVEHSCPSCNGTDIEVWLAGGYSATKLGYCPWCGQKIDWTHEEEQ